MKKIFYWKWEAKFRSQYLFAGSCSDVEILQDLDLHNYVCVENGTVWFGAVLEVLFHILKIKYAQKNAHFWEQKLLLLLLLIKKYIQVPWTYQKLSFVYSKEPLWNKIFRQKS